MMLYTIYPLELILADDDEKIEAPVTMEVEGVKLIVEAAGSDQYKIVQLISSDPRDFLDERFQPGKAITMKPLLNG